MTVGPASAGAPVEAGDAGGLTPAIPEAALTPVDCGLCGSAERSLRFREDPFEVVECAGCGQVYVTPRLADASLLEHVYDESYWTSAAAKVHGYTDYRADAPLYRRTYRKRLSVLRRHFGARRGRVLDVGCAAGYFLSVMRAEGWDVRGLEPSDAIRAAAAEELGAERVSGELLGADGLAPGSYDLVTFWDVIEHIPDPRAALVRARELLAPGGLLLLETQDVSSRAARLLGPRWQHYKHAEHIYHFDPRTLGRLLDEAGFETLENTPRLGGKYVTLGFIAERVGRIHPLLSVLAAPLRLVGRVPLYVNLFDEMIVVARPKDGAA